MPRTEFSKTGHVELGERSTVSNEKPERVYLVDGFGLLYRSYFALVKTTMTAKDMFDTRAVYGFTNVLLSLLQKHVDGHAVIVVFEGRRKDGELDHRRARYPEYKSGRSKTPAGIIAAIPWVKRIVRALGLSTAEHDLYEADDVIGTLVRRAKRDGVRTVIVSVDKDFRQLLDGDLVTILKPGARDKPFEHVTEETFRSEFEDLHPSKYVDVLTLIGDAADSIKGVPGIGPRSAPKLIKHFGSLEALLKAAQQLAPPNEETRWTMRNLPKELLVIAKELPLRKAESLRYYEQRTLLMKSMITIRDNVGVMDLSWNEYQRSHVNVQEVNEICDRLEFTKMLRTRMHRSTDNVRGYVLSSIETDGLTVDTVSETELVRVESVTSVSPEAWKSVAEGSIPESHDDPVSCTDYNILDNEYEVDEKLRNVSGRVGISLVLSENDMGVPILDGVAISSGKGTSFFVDCRGKSKLPKSLSRLMEDGGIEKVGWFMKDNVKALLSSYGIFMQGRLFDVRIAADLLHAGQRLSDTALTSMYLWEDALKSSLAVDELKKLSPPARHKEALVLSDLGLQLSQKLREELSERGLERIAEHVEFPLIPVVAEMELCGVPLQSDALRVFEEQVKKQVAHVESRLSAIAPNNPERERAFRPSSLKDVGDALFVQWRIKSVKGAGESGRFCVNKKVLASVANNSSLREEQREFARLMMQYRETSKILNTYTSSLLRSVRPDGRVRATIVQDASPSGRLSTSKPNLQSIPVRSALGRELRRTVMAPRGFELLCADYSQIELRILAAMSGDVALRAAFSRGVDVHTAVAAHMFQLDTTAVTADQRSLAKQVVYGIPYGISAMGLSNQLSVPIGEARDLIATFRAQFPSVHDLTRSLVAQARTNGYAQTLAGRRLQLPILLLGAPQERRAAERVAVNMPVQGTLADMIKIAMARIAKRLREGKARSRLMLQLHDELVLEVCREERDAVKDLVEEEMCHALPLPGVEVVVNVGIGECWLSAAPH